jgi:hypothetical protein
VIDTKITKLSRNVFFLGKRRKRKNVRRKKKIYGKRNVEN